jgi:glucosamine-phosphate N-acetyltransferase
MNDFIIRPIQTSDFFDGYIELMVKLTNHNKEIDEEFFNNYIQNNFIKIIVVYSNNMKKIVGAGSIFILQKLHCGPVGQIEDVIIQEEFRNNGIGKLIINKLIEIGKNDFHCYKVILNCLDKNVEFYNKCNFIVSGNQMRYKN